MKIPPKKPHFLKPIHKGFKNGLKIPTGFLKYVKGLEHIEYAILKRAGKKWLVKVKCWRFEAGWAEFVEQHDVQLGDLLIFRHEGDMEFEVSIFDSSHCDREYAEYLQGGGNNVEETSKNFEFKGKLNLCVMSSSKAFPHAEAGTHNPCGKSHFECTVRPYCISNGYLRLPKQFATENGLINKKCDVIIKDERQRSWNLRLATHNSIVHVLGGWGEFCVANDLKEGDYMMFEVIANGEKPIWKFHNKPNPNIVSSRKTFPKEEPATNSSFGQSHFVCTVRPYCLSRNYLCLPRRFAQASGLVNKKCSLIIRDERQRSWNLRLDNYGYRVYISKGWRKFCVDNDLKEGDCITFEVVTCGEKSIWKFHDRPNRNSMSTREAFPKGESETHSSFDQSHFMCIVRAYCVSHSYLRLPKKFAIANGLVNKNCGVVIRDERQRAWNLRLATFGSSVHILGEWDEFLVANDLNVGDCMIFEVVANGEKPLWKFYGAATHKPFGQSHFACTVRPYCLSNDLFYIPTKFALANGLTNKKCDLIVRDEMERSWNFRLCSFGSTVCIRGGWHEFRDANCLKEGDCIMFEVVSNGNTPIWKYNVDRCVSDRPKLAYFWRNRNRSIKLFCFICLDFHEYL